MKKLLITFIAFLLVLGVFPNTNYASEVYYNKGASYTGNHTNNLGQTINYNQSFVVISASANQNAGAYNSIGRIFSRCDVVKSYYKAHLCYANDAQIYFQASLNSNGDPKNYRNLVTTVTPRPTSAYSGGLWSYAIRLLPYGDIPADFIEAIVNSGKFSVTHSIGINHENASVLFQNINTSQIDVPSSITYNNIEKTYNGQSKGYSAAFTTQVAPGYYTLKGDLTYDIRVTVDPLVPPLVLYIQTKKAVKTYTIGL